MGWFSDVGDAIGGAAQTIGDTAKTIGETAIQTVTDPVGMARETVTGAADEVKNRIVDPGSTIVPSMLPDVIQEPLDKVMSTFEDIGDAFRNLVMGGSSGDSGSGGLFGGDNTKLIILLGALGVGAVLLLILLMD